MCGAAYNLNSQTPEPAGPVREPSPGPYDETVLLPPVPTVEAETTLVSASPLPEAESHNVIDDEASLVTSSDKENASLPSAPESVVLAGATPGPEVALSTSEPDAVSQSVDANTIATGEDEKAS